MIFFDTSVLVSGLIEAHPHYEKSNHWLGKIISGKEKGGISSHTIAELYSSLTTIHILAAQKMKASIILTLNLKHFLTIWPEGKNIFKNL